MSGLSSVGKSVISVLDQMPLVKRPLKKLRQIKRHYLRKSEGEKILVQRYERFFKRRLSLGNPQTFTEKVFCKMIALNRQNDPLLTKLADKLLVRDWVKSKIGDEHLVKVFWTGEDPEKIPFENLPEKCAIKTNHGSGQVIVKNGRDLDQEKVRKQLTHWLSENFYWAAREPQYYGIKPRIVIEEFLDDGEEDGPLDFRFWCFNGKAEILQVDDHSHAINPFFDCDWNLLNLSYRHNTKTRGIQRPENFSRMIEIANKLSSEFDFVRVDLYNLHGKILFGEMTFTPAAGSIKFEPPSWDAKLGELWKIDPKYRINGQQPCV